MLRSMFRAVIFVGWSLTSISSRSFQKIRPLTRLWSSKSSQNNAGLVIHDGGPGIVALWKTSNVALDERTRLSRPAAEPVTLFAAKHVPGGRLVWPSLLLTADTAGLLLVAQRPTVVRRAVYTAVVAAASLPTQALTHQALAVDVNVLQSAPSGTHGQLHLVACTITWPPSTTTNNSPAASDVAIPTSLTAALAAAETTVVRDGSPLLALVELHADTDAGPYVARHDVPAKFLKYLRRERILSERLAEQQQRQEQQQQQEGGGGQGGGEAVTFMG